MNLEVVILNARVLGDGCVTHMELSHIQEHPQRLWCYWM